MDEAAFAARARELAAGVPVEVHPEVRAHPFVPGRRCYLEVVEGEPETRLALFHGSFREAAAAEPAFDELAALEGAVRLGLERLEEDRVTAEAVPDEEALFETHARFRRGLPVPEGWYRRGESRAPGVWWVDLDVFVEIALPCSVWETLRGRRVELGQTGEDLEVLLPEDLALDEVWTLEGCGVFEPAPGIELDDLEEMDELDLQGRFGDLHVVPYAF